MLGSLKIGFLGFATHLLIEFCVLVEIFVVGNLYSVATWSYKIWPSHTGRLFPRGSANLVNLGQVMRAH